MRIAFFCMESSFSVRPLEALLAAGHEVCLVVRPLGSAASEKAPVLKRHRAFDNAVRRLLRLPATGDLTRDPLAVAARANIPAWIVGDASQSRMIRRLVQARVDLIVVAFFNQLLKPAVYQAARLGAINLHPSLLPRYRGRAPLFWMFRNGETEGGLSVHRIDAGEDTGPLLAQQRVRIAFGTPGEAYVDALAEQAGPIVTRVVAELEAGRCNSWTQSAIATTRAPRPKGADLLVDPCMGARRAFSFVRGVGRWNDVCVAVGDRHVRVVDAVALEEDKRMPGECVSVGDLLQVGFDDGVVTFRAIGLTS